MRLLMYVLGAAEFILKFFLSLILIKKFPILRSFIAAVGRRALLTWFLNV